MSTHVFTQMYIYVQICTCIYTHTYIYTHIHGYTHMHIHAHIQARTHVYLWMYISIYWRTYLHCSGRGRLHIEFACALLLHVCIRCARAPSTQRLSQNRWFTFNVAHHQKFERCAISARVMLRTIACLCVLINAHNISLWRCATQHVCECL